MSLTFPHISLFNRAYSLNKALAYIVLNDDGLEEETPVPPLEDPSIPAPESWRRGDPCYPIYLKVHTSRSRSSLMI